MRPLRVLPIVGIVVIALILTSALLSTTWSLHPVPSNARSSDVLQSIQWTKTVNGQETTGTITLTVETSDTVKVVDVIALPVSVSFPITLAEFWDPAHLKLLHHELNTGDVVMSATGMEWVILPSTAGVMTLTKWFHIERCTWITTTLAEELLLHPPLLEPNPVRMVEIEKVAPELHVSAVYDPELTEPPYSFTLVYSNTGGYENNVVLSTTFPSHSPFVSAVPPPDDLSPDKLQTAWQLGDLANNSIGEIDVTYEIQEKPPPSSIVITNVIANHVGQVEDYYLVSTHPAEAAWHKFVNDVPWQLEFGVTVQTSDTLKVVDAIYPEIPDSSFVLVEEWDKDRLQLIDIYANAGVLADSPGGQFWTVAPVAMQPVTLTKFFHVEPSTWEETQLVEVIEGSPVAVPERVVHVHKLLPELAIREIHEPEVYAGQIATFILSYENRGGYENNVAIGNFFPPQALFVSSTPPPTWQSADRRETMWRVGDLANAQGGQIEVSVAIEPNLPPSTTVTIQDVILNHLEEAVVEVSIVFHVREPPVGEDHDIYLKDSSLDDGSVPQAASWWESPDIWVRRDGDCDVPMHEDPLPGGNHAICVRLRNRMNTDVSAVSIDLYWGSAALGMAWPSSWTYIGGTTIAHIPGGATEVRTIPWQVPSTTGHFCLLARAGSPADPLLAGPDTVQPVDDVPNNNNITMKNLDIVDFPKIDLCGVYSTAIASDVTVFDAVNTLATPVDIAVELRGEGFPLATGTVQLDPGSLSGRWQSLHNFNQSGNMLELTAWPAVMDGIRLEPHERARMTMTVSARVDVPFTLHIQELSNGEVVGGIRFERRLLDCGRLPALYR